MGWDSSHHSTRADPPRARKATATGLWSGHEGFAKVGWQPLSIQKDQSFPSFCPVGLDPTRCPSLLVQVSIRFHDPTLASAYSRTYGCSPDFQPTPRVCNGLIRRLDHCLEELVIRRESSLDKSRRERQIRFELSFRTTRAETSERTETTERTFRAYRTEPLTVDSAKEVVLTTHRLVGETFEQYDPSFTWLDPSRPRKSHQRRVTFSDSLSVSASSSCEMEHPPSSPGTPGSDARSTHSKRTIKTAFRRIPSGLRDALRGRERRSLSHVSAVDDFASDKEDECHLDEIRRRESMASSGTEKTRLMSRLKGRIKNALGSPRRSSAVSSDTSSVETVQIPRPRLSKLFSETTQSSQESSQAEDRPCTPPRKSFRMNPEHGFSSPDRASQDDATELVNIRPATNHGLERRSIGGDSQHAWGRFPSLASEVRPKTSGGSVGGPMRSSSRAFPLVPRSYSSSSHYLLDASALDEPLPVQKAAQEPEPLPVSACVAQEDSLNVQTIAKLEEQSAALQETVDVPKCAVLMTTEPTQKTPGKHTDKEEVETVEVEAQGVLALVDSDEESDVLAKDAAAAPRDDVQSDVPDDEAAKESHTSPTEDEALSSGGQQLQEQAEESATLTSEEVAYAEPSVVERIPYDCLATRCDRENSPYSETKEPNSTVEPLILVGPELQAPTTLNKDEPEEGSTAPSTPRSTASDSHHSMFATPFYSHSQCLITPATEPSSETYASLLAQPSHPLPGKLVFALNTPLDEDLPWPLPEEALSSQLGALPEQSPLDGEADAVLVTSPLNEEDLRTSQIETNLESTTVSNIHPSTMATEKLAWLSEEPALSETDLTSFDAGDLLVDENHVTSKLAESVVNESSPSFLVEATQANVDEGNQSLVEKLQAALPADSELLSRDNLLSPPMVTSMEPELDKVTTEDVVLEHSSLEAPVCKIEITPELANIADTTFNSSLERNSLVLYNEKCLVQLDDSLPTLAPPLRRRASLSTLSLTSISGKITIGGRDSVDDVPVLWDVRTSTDHYPEYRPQTAGYLGLYETRLVEVGLRGALGMRRHSMPFQRHLQDVADDKNASVPGSASSRQEDAASLAEETDDHAQGMLPRAMMLFAGLTTGKFFHKKT